MGAMRYRSRRAMSSRPRDRVGIRLVITYKLAKGIAQGVSAAVLTGLVLFGYGPELAHLADQLRRHVAGAWSLRLADWLVALASPHRLWEVVVALILDGAFTLFEGLSLERGYGWAPWLVVIATSSLLPFEIVSLARHPHEGRIVLLIVNLSIALYLLTKVRRERPRREEGRE